MCVNEYAADVLQAKEDLLPAMHLDGVLGMGGSDAGGDWMFAAV